MARFVWAFVVFALELKSAVCDLSGLRTFGDARVTPYAAVNATQEYEFFEHKMTPGSGRAATMTYLQVQTGKDVRGRYIADTMIIRIYVDDEATASLEFTPSMAAGSGVGLESLDYYMTDPANTSRKCGDSRHPLPGQDWTTCGMDLLDGWPWETKFTGKLTGEGGWVIKIRVPFLKSLRATAQISNRPDIPIPPGPPPGHPTWTGVTCFFVVRGLEGPELDIARTMAIGGIAPPPVASWNVKLRLFKLEGYQARPMEFVPLVNFTGSHMTGGALLMSTVNINMLPSSLLSADLTGGAVEGCFWALLDPSASLNQGAVLLGEGFEDFYESSFGFTFWSKPYHGSSAGLSHIHGGPAPPGDTKRPTRFSAYKFCDADPVLFEGGRFELVWRNGAAFTSDYRKCTMEANATQKPGGHTVVDSYHWVYTWEQPVGENSIHI